MADKSHPDPETAPDPDSDDLDDLDDVLDEFNKTSLDTAPKAPAPSAASTTAPSASGPGRPAADEDDFAAQLQAGMASLIGELDNNPDMQKQFEGLMKELSGAAEGAAPAGTGTAQPKAAPAPAAAAAEGEDFQATIRRTMERMQASGDSAGQAAASSSEEDMLAQMLKGLQDGGAGEGGEEDFNKMLLGMMEQLTNKEILYEPMKELHDKFPAWMEKNAGKVGAEDLGRYQEQQRLVGEITGRFERKGYSDGNEQDREYIVERMQKMQAAGSPPPDLVGDMSAAQEALGDLDSGCPQQ